MKIDEAKCSILWRILRTGKRSTDHNAVMLEIKLKKSFKKFCGRYKDLIEKYQRSGE